ncbi:MAG: hypothetical protein GF350_15425 [Chitinivibrionales bacterium]|nr:hypothetical protein [Chitinivibrionales bacterium]
MKRKISWYTVMASTRSAQFFFIVQCAWCISICTGAGNGAAVRERPDTNSLSFSGYGQFWFKYEHVENGKFHQTTGEQAAQEATGFSINRLRLFFGGFVPSTRAFFSIGARLENRIELLDCYAGWYFHPLLQVILGQCKVPSASELLQAPSQTDFISVSRVSAEMAEWMFIRTPYIGLYEKSRSYRRDAGLSIKGFSADSCIAYHCMIGNGFGANRFMGGYEKHRSGNFFANKAGDFFYGIRLDTRAIPFIRLGAAGSINRHENLIANDTKTVRHFDRRNAVADIDFHFPFRIQLSGLYALGMVGDNYAGSAKLEKNALDYSGFSCALIGGAFWKERVCAGVRFDRYMYEFDENTHEYADDQVTIGISFTHKPALLLQWNYIYKKYKEQYRRGLDDNILVLNVRFAFAQSYRKRNNGQG